MKIQSLIVAALAVAASVITVQAGPVTTLIDTTSDYTGIQGLNGLQYGYFLEPSTTFTTTGFTYGDTVAGWWALGNTGGSNFAFVGPNSQAHPGYNASTQQSYDTVRRYTDSYTGLVNFSGIIAKQDTGAPAGQTVSGNIYLNGVSIYSQVVAGNNGIGFTYNFNRNLVAGDIVDFAVSTGPGSSIQHDLTTFGGHLQTVAVTTPTPEPTTLALSAGFIGISLVLRRKLYSAR